MSRAPAPSRSPNPPHRWPPGVAVRRDAGLYGLERHLRRHGFGLIAGADEAGRGACAGPLVAAAAVLPDGRQGQVPGLADSKLLTPTAREAVYAEVVHRALAWAVVSIPPAECDRMGLHVANVAALRRAVGLLGPAAAPSYVLIDGFPVAGLGVPSLAVWKGDRVAACVAAASVLAKVTRDRMMCELGSVWPAYEFARHKGYNTPEHLAALAAQGPCSEHRRSFITVRSVLGGGSVVEVRAGDGAPEPADVPATNAADVTVRDPADVRVGDNAAMGEHARAIRAQEFA